MDDTNQRYRQFTAMQIKLQNTRDTFRARSRVNTLCTFYENEVYEIITPFKCSYARSLSRTN